MFRRLYKEIPYEVQIEDVSFKTLMDGSLRIEKNLMVRSDQVSALHVQICTALVRNQYANRCEQITATLYACKYAIVGHVLERQPDDSQLRGLRLKRGLSDPYLDVRRFGAL